MTNPTSTWFETATRGVLALLADVPPSASSAPGLGDWTLLELIAHTCRSWTLIGTYLGEPEPAAGPEVGTAGFYFARGLTQPGIHEGVLARGREDATAMGEDPIAFARRSAARALEEAAATPTGRLIATRICPLPFTEFLRTRAFELTVHGLDIARASGRRLPTELEEACAPALILVSEIAAERGLAAPLLLAASGRAGLPDHFNLLA
jgi:uncharacterized protein (TIGR03083 family)